MYRADAVLRQQSAEPATPLADDHPTLGYYALLFLIFIIFIAPQALIPALEPLHLAKVAAGFAVVAYGLRAVSGVRTFAILNAEVKLLCALVACVLLSFIYSRWPGGSVEFFLDQYSKTLIVFFLVANVLTSMVLVRKFVWLIVICSAFNGIVGFVNYKNGVLMGDNANRIMGGYSGITSNPNDLALSLNLALPFMYYLYRTSGSTTQRGFAVGAALLSLIVIIVTFSRGGFLTLCALLLWAAYAKWHARGKLVMGVNLVLVAVLILAIVLIAPAGYSDRVLSIFDASKDETGSREARWEMMEGSVRTMLHSPWGIGFHMNNLGLREAGLGWSGVHNVYLEIGTELGFLGLGLFLALQRQLFKAMREVREKIERADVNVLAGAIQASMWAFAVAAMFHPVAYHYYFYILAGLAIALRELALNDGPLSRRS